MLVTVERRQHRVGVADVDAQQHTPLPLVVLPFSQIQGDVEDRGGVGQRAHGQVVHAGGGVLAARARVSPPVASNSARSPTAATTRRSSSGRMLSQSRKSAPAAHRRLGLGDRAHLYLDRHIRVRLADQTVRLGYPAGGADVVVLDHRHVVEPHALVDAAAGPDRVFSSARRPGVVLRVSSTCALCRRARPPSARVWVATPDIRHSRFNAVRSAVSSARTRPRTVASTWPVVTAAPSATAGLERHRGSMPFEDRRRHRQPGDHPVGPGHQLGGARAGRPGWSRELVTSSRSGSRGPRRAPTR